MKKLLVVIDMVNGFVNFGALADKEINKVTPNIVKLIERAKSKGVEIVAFKDAHSQNDEEFKVYPPHCIKGSAESDLIDELKPYEKDMTLIDKNTTNGFITQEFLNIVAKNNYDKVFVTGCCTDICVIDFVTSYINYAHENKLNTQLVVFEDACYTFDTPNHNAQNAHNTAIEKMAALGATIANTQQLNNEQEKSC